MKEAVGGIFNIQAIIIFLVLAIGLLLFSVNYTKAFKVKNDFRRVIEEFEGLTPSASKKIDQIAEKYRYSFDNPGTYIQICESMEGYKAYRSLLDNGEYVVFCAKCNLTNVEGTEEGQLRYKGATYDVITFVNIDIPIINKIFPQMYGFLRIRGETDLIYSSGNNTELCQYANTDGLYTQ